MSRAPKFIGRNGKTSVYRAEIAVPKALQKSHFQGRKFLRKSLGTHDPREAELMAMPWIHNWKLQIKAAYDGATPDTAVLPGCRKALVRPTDNELSFKFCDRTKDMKK